MLDKMIAMMTPGNLVGATGLLTLTGVGIYICNREDPTPTRLQLIMGEMRAQGTLFKPPLEEPVVEVAPVAEVTSTSVTEASPELPPSDGYTNPDLPKILYPFPEKVDLGDISTIPVDVVDWIRRQNATLQNNMVSSWTMLKSTGMSENSIRNHLKQIASQNPGPQFEFEE